MLYRWYISTLPNAYTHLIWDNLALNSLFPDGRPLLNGGVLEKPILLFAAELAHRAAIAPSLFAYI